MPRQYTLDLYKSAAVEVDSTGKTIDLQNMRTDEHRLIAIDNQGDYPVHYEWSDDPADVFVLSWPPTGAVEVDKSKMVPQGRVVTVKIKGRYLSLKTDTGLVAIVTVQTGKFMLG